MNRFINLFFVLTPVVLAAAVNFLSLPLICRALTKHDAGIWFLLVDIATVALALDFGISNIQVRTMAKCVNDKTSISQVFYDGRRVLGLVSLVIFVLGISCTLVYYFSIKRFDIEILISLLIFISAISINLYGYSFVGLVRSLEKFSRIAFVALISNLTYLILILLLIKYDPKLIVLSCIYLFRNFVSFLGFRYFSKDLVEKCSAPTKFVYSGEHIFVFSNTLTLYLYLAVESIILSWYYPSALVASYIAQRKFFDFTKSGIDAYLASIFPKMSREIKSGFFGRILIYTITTVLIYVFLYLATPIAMQYIVSTKYSIDRSLLLLIAMQFVFSAISIYVRQSNIAIHLSKKALISAVLELSIKMILSIALLPIVSYKAIPVSSIIGALVSILFGSSPAFRSKK